MSEHSETWDEQQKHRIVKFNGFALVEQTGEWSGNTKITISVDGREIPNMMCDYDGRLVKVTLELIPRIK